MMVVSTAAHSGYQSGVSRDSSTGATTAARWVYYKAGGTVGPMVETMAGTTVEQTVAQTADQTAG